MARKPDRSSQFGPFIRDLSLPVEEMPLRPGRLRRSRLTLQTLPGRLYSAAMAAWTLGLVLATFGLLQSTGARMAEPANERPSGVGGAAPPLSPPDP